jgi:putative iron-only hydrogenase system regulator
VPFGVQGFYIFRKEFFMETRIALIGIVVEHKESAKKINDVLHEYGEYIVGRMGIPYPKRSVSVISIVVDAPNDIISALSGKLGMIPHVNTKTVYSKLSSQ